MQRIGMVIGIRPDRIEQYRELHARVWPEVLALLSKHNIRNYSIYHHGDRLFGYLEYEGADFAADLARLGEEPAMREWYAVCGPCQQPLPDRRPGEWWTVMDEVFHMD